MKGARSFPLPMEFLKRMQGQLGNQFEAFIEALESPLLPSIRMHPFKKALRYEFQLTNPVEWACQGYYLNKRPVFTLDPVFHAGGYYVQEPSSMLMEKVIKYHLENIKDACVLDLCASPGGKSTSILSQLNGKGLLVSNEIISTRISGLQHNLIKWGFSNRVITQSDPERFKQLPGFFDLIMIDAPCSGEGLFRKDQSSRLEWSEYYTNQCKMRQQRILNDVMDALKPGGILIYSTCTYNPEENINQLDFLQNLGMQSQVTPYLEHYPLVRIEKGRVHGFQAYPHLMQGEGFFIGVLKKYAHHPERSQPGVNRQIQWTSLPQVDGLPPFAEQNCAYFIHQGQYFDFPVNEKHRLEALGGALRIVEAGTAVGQIKNNDFIPAHGLALKVNCPVNLETIDLEKEHALRYLRKETIETAGKVSSYQLIRYQGLNLGWVKRLKDRTNNLYPKNYRILMSG